MKKYFLTLFSLLVLTNVYSQIEFEKGYYIDQADQKVECWIKNTDWLNNPSDFKYKLLEGGEIQNGDIGSVKAFGVDNVSKYQRATLDIDKSSELIDDLSTQKNPIFEEETVFLKLLIEGKANLYYYENSKVKRYFYSIDNAEIKQLVYKSYRSGDNVKENVYYKQQLALDLTCSSINEKRYKSLAYTNKKLTQFFKEYNNCNNSTTINYNDREKRDLFNLGFRPRLNVSTLTITDVSPTRRNVDFDTNISFGFGIDLEFILPVHKNKWAVTIEPTYQYFTAEDTQPSESILGGQLISNVDYKTIDIPFGIRHYFFLNNSSKLFLNASYVFDLNLDSTVEYRRANNDRLATLDGNPGNSIALGLGYKLKEKFNVELRYAFDRDIQGNLLFVDAQYKTISVIVGYSIF